MTIKIDAHIQALPATIPFVAPERTERESGNQFVARLGANENNLGCSPNAIEAMARIASQSVGQYADPENFSLRRALCQHLGIEMNNVVIGSGIDGLLGLIVRIFSSPKDTILTSAGAYPTFNYHVAAYDRTLLTVPYRDDHEDLDALAQEAQKTRPAIVYVSNPDNPMGTWWPAKDIENFINKIPEDTLIILDEAYGETAPEGTLPAIDCTRANLLRVRTFSKAYGIAGLRCGYAIGNSALILPFEKIRNHFGINIMAQAASEAALKDQEWLMQTLETNAQARDRLSAIAIENGLKPIKSATNFVTIDCGQDGAYAMQVLKGLMERRIFVRKPMAPVLDRCIRVSTGKDEEINQFSTALAAVLKDLQ
ncbi:pyridoxal phosphate-dependent aminotransferase [Ahrensia kielensis]|uniref:Pyridoxal phosphate-dependent aminotransferase n=1 Tax=Ahrensia kielensis TaxID=76980 RepID=A0ABU9T8E8_9HYPH